MASLVALGPKSPAVWAKSSLAQQAKLQPPGRPLLPSASFQALGLLPLPVRAAAHSHRADTQVLVILQLNDVTSAPILTKFYKGDVGRANLENYLLLSCKIHLTQTLL